MTEYLTDHEASVPAIMLGCVAEIRQSVPAFIGKGVAGQKADLNEAAGTADAATGSPSEGRIRPMHLRWGAGKDSLPWRPTPSRRRGRKDVLLLPTVCLAVEWGTERRHKVKTRMWEES